jgi:taurine dioxygenase
MTIQATPTEANFGAVVRGIDLAQPLDSAARETIETLIGEYKVLSFPGQPLSLAELESFTRSLGEFGEDPFIEPMPGYPHVLELRREPDETVSNFGAGWHSDWSFQDTPPSYTILHGQTIPPVGGDTLFCDCQAAWDDLDPNLQARLKNLRGIHSAILPYSPRGVYAQDQDQRAMNFRLSEEAEKTHTHPLVRVHPISGRLSIYANQVYTIGIEGLPGEEAAALLNELHEHLVQDRYLYRHRWAADTLLIWDNRAVNHFADGGYDGYLRVMHRTTVKGEAPVAA